MLLEFIFTDGLLISAILEDLESYWKWWTRGHRWLLLPCFFVLFNKVTPVLFNKIYFFIQVY